MDLNGAGAIVTGGASGLGEASVRAIVSRGGRAVIADVNEEKGSALADELGDAALFVKCDVTVADEVEAAVTMAKSEFGGLRFAVGCAGIGWAQRTITKDGPALLDPFELVVKVNLIGMYNLLRLSAAAMNENEPDSEGERGCVVMTASVAAFDGQIGQTAYSASKGGVAALTLPAARDLAGRGIRVVTIAPGMFDTPLLALLPAAAREELGANVPFPSRLGRPEEYGELACAVAANTMLNGETIRLDGALRMPPR
ncbi:MAG: SDR family NAD(P)-dependent oxidoreductase [Solirubrobacterales bacterium]